MIEVNRLNFSYTNKPFITDVTFSVKAGEIFGLLGPSGAGKSTLQKLMCGLLTGYKGSVRVMDTEVKERKNSFYEHIGIDFEFPALYEKLTARQNLEFFGSLYSIKLRNIDELLACVELSNDGDKKVSDFSKGMKSRLGFIRALINDPQILFLDEPTAGLDPTNARMMKDVIIKEKKKGKSVILTTHNMADATELCDRVAFIVNGKIAAMDTPHALTMLGGGGKLRYTWLDDGREQSAECLLDKTGKDLRLKELIALGKLLTVHSCEPSLGDVFMDVTGRTLV